MLKTLLNPKVKDICPNCGKACITTDVLCPNCGKNLDELFEQLPDEKTSSYTFSKRMIVPMKAKTSRAWRVLNGLILVTAFVVPWEIVYSDVGPSKPRMILGLMVLLDSLPSDLSYIFSFDCLSCVSTGLSAIGYLSLAIYTVLNFLYILRIKSYHQNLQKALGFCIITSSLFFLRIDFPMVMIVLAWGYWLACAGLLSSLCLETTELMSGKGLVNEAVPKAA